MSASHQNGEHEGRCFFQKAMKTCHIVRFSATPIAGKAHAVMLKQEPPLGTNGTEGQNEVEKEEGGRDPPGQSDGRVRKWRRPKHYTRYYAQIRNQPCSRKAPRPVPAGKA